MPDPELCSRIFILGRLVATNTPTSMISFLRTIVEQRKEDSNKQNRHSTSNQQNSWLYGNSNSWENSKKKKGVFITAPLPIKMDQSLSKQSLKQWKTESNKPGAHDLNKDSHGEQNAQV